jgi:hypothetical protein
MEGDKPQEEIQNISFSPDLAFINIGTSEGFRLHSSDPETPVHSDRLRGK